MALTRATSHRGSIMSQRSITLSRRGLLRMTGVAAIGLGGAPLAACSASKKESSPSSGTSSASELVGRSLSVYCGAGMTDPFTEIAQGFEDQSGCTMNVTYANAAQIRTQINQSRSGDLWIAGSTEEAQGISELIAHSTDLVKHVPVLAVPEKNPMEISSLSDLTAVKSLLIGDPESTPIGKIARSALTEAGIWESLQDRITTTTTAPQIASALAKGQGDAGIVWKENLVEGTTAVASSEMAPFTKTIPAIELSCTGDQEALTAFVSHLGGEQARSIWTSHGYELL